MNSSTKAVCINARPVSEVDYAACAACDLLARAVAGECGAHIEIVNGPALLSKWVGETEAALRDVFQRAQKFAPAVVLFDEIDSIAPSRSAESAQHQVSVVAQLLVLLDGIEERGQIFVLATTNRPEHVDPALRRPGRFDQVVWMGLPDERGRADIFGHYLRRLKLDPRLTPDRLAAEMAGAARGLTGADCQGAADPGLGHTPGNAPSAGEPHRQQQLFAGHVRGDDLERTREAGFAGHVVKPFDVDELAQRIHTLLIDGRPAGAARLACYAASQWSISCQAIWQSNTVPSNTGSDNLTAEFSLTS